MEECDFPEFYEALRKLCMLPIHYVVIYANAKLCLGPSTSQNLTLNFDRISNIPSYIMSSK